MMRRSPLVIAAAAWLALTACRPAPPLTHPNVLLITLDTTRADHLGLYGQTRPTSPHLDALARAGAHWTRAYTTATWTLPAHASLFTGKYPKTHGAKYDDEGAFTLGDVLPGPAEFRTLRARGLAPGEPTLARLLQTAGYRTGAIVAGPWMKRLFGLGAGFEHYDDERIANANGRPARDVTDAAIRWLDAGDTRPFFLFLNYFDAHSPFYPKRRCLDAISEPAERPQGETSDPRELLLLYAAEIRCVDEEFGRLLAHLRARDLYDSTWIIVTADHGEHMGEHGDTGHGKSLYDVELRVPLVVKPPRGEGPLGAQDELVQISDLYPWILTRIGVRVPEGVQGAFPAGARPVVAEVDRPQIGPRGSWRAIVDGDWKYLENDAGTRLLFDVVRDPAESDDRLAGEPERARVLAERLGTLRAAMPDAPASAARDATLDDATRRALESLGYVEETAPAGDARERPRE